RDDDRPSGGRLVVMRRAARLGREGGGLRRSDAGARANLRDVDAIRADPALEKALGQDGFRTLEWYRTGLDRCRSIARIETLSGQAMGTGWLLDASAFFGGRHAGQALLLTNAHVISPKG